MRLSFASFVDQRPPDPPASVENSQYDHRSGLGTAVVVDEIRVVDHHPCRLAESAPWRSDARELRDLVQSGFEQRIIVVGTLTTASLFDVRNNGFIVAFGDRRQAYKRHRVSQTFGGDARLVGP